MKEWVIIQDAKEEGIEEGLEQGIELGLTQGLEKGRLEGIVLRDNEKIADMLRRGKTFEEIVDFCNYPYELVKKIEEELSVDA